MGHHDVEHVAEVAGGGRRVDGQRAELEVLGAVVVQQEEHVALAEHGVLERVLHAVAARHDHAELPGRVRRVEHPRLARDLRRRADHQVALGLGAPDAGEEALVGLLVHQHVGGVAAEAVAPDAVGPPGVVDGRVEEVAAVGGPGDAAARARDLVGQHLAGAQVLDADRVPLVADDVGAPGQEVLVVAEREPAEGEEVVTLGLLVGVEQHLLARHRLAGDEGGRVPVVGGLHAGAAPDGVLPPLLGARVVPPPAVAHRDRQVGLQGA